jgi:hypothetical protein
VVPESITATPTLFPSSPFCHAPTASSMIGYVVTRALPSSGAFWTPPFAAMPASRVM